MKESKLVVRIGAFRSCPLVAAFTLGRPLAAPGVGSGEKGANLRGGGGGVRQSPASVLLGARGVELKRTVKKNKSRYFRPR